MFMFKKKHFKTELDCVQVLFKIPYYWDLKIMKMWGDLNSRGGGLNSLGGPQTPFRNPALYLDFIKKIVFL